MGQDMVLVVRLVDKLHRDHLHILSLIKDASEYQFGECLLFVLANLLPTYTHPLLMNVILKQSKRGNLVNRNHSAAQLLMNRA